MDLEANPVMSITARVEFQGISEREAVINLILRLVQGLDNANPELTRSAFTHDAVFDLKAISKLGKPYNEIQGRDSVVASLMKSVGNIDFIYFVSNFRVYINKDLADLTVYAIA